MKNKSVIIKGKEISLCDNGNAKIEIFYFFYTQTKNKISFGCDSEFDSLEDFRYSIREITRYTKKEIQLLESLIPFEYKINYATKDILNEAVSALYFDDKSDYKSYFYKIISLITGLDTKEIDKVAINEIYNATTED